MQIATSATANRLENRFNRESIRSIKRDRARLKSGVTLAFEITADGRRMRIECTPLNGEFSCLLPCRTSLVGTIRESNAKLREE